MAESCSGRTGELSAVQWYQVPGAVVLNNGKAVSGYWSSDGNRIVLAEDHVDNGVVVRHEMLHALLREPGHPRAEFLDACASVVACADECVLDAGPWQAPTSRYLTLAPDSLEIASTAELLPVERDGQRWVALRVTAHNPRGSAVVIAAPGNTVTPGTFAYFVTSPEGGISGGDIASDSSMLFFQPNETKSRLFELRVTSPLTEYHVPAGTALVRGGYARHWTANDTVNVVP